MLPTATGTPVARLGLCARLGSRMWTACMALHYHLHGQCILTLPLEIMQNSESKKACCPFAGSLNPPSHCLAMQGRAYQMPEAQLPVLLSVHELLGEGAAVCCLMALASCG